VVRHVWRAEISGRRIGESSAWLAPLNRGSLDSAHIHGTLVPVEEPSTASSTDSYTAARVRSACIFVTLDRTDCGALSRRSRGRWDDQVAGCATLLMTSRSAVSVLPLVSGPSSTEITTRTRKSIVLIIIGMANPKFICTAR
jgi:hypothetical protein